MLALAHYSLRLSSVFVSEICFAYIMNHHFRVKKSTDAMKVQELMNTGIFLAKILRNEHILDDKVEPNDFFERLRFIAGADIVTFDSDKQELRLNINKQAPLFDLFTQMCEAYVDTYLIVCLTIEQICGKHVILKQKLLITELHTVIKHLYTAKVLPHLHSCMDEILTTAILRFE